MADIDKGLPNTRTKLEVPSEEELQEIAVQEPEQEKPVEVHEFSPLDVAACFWLEIPVTAK